MTGSANFLNSVFAIIGFVIVSWKVWLRQSRITPQSGYWLWFVWYHQILNVLELAKDNDVLFLWENLDEPPTNILGSALASRLFGIHGPARIEAHCAIQNVENVLLRYRWQWQEIRLLDSYHVKRAAILPLPISENKEIASIRTNLENKLLFVSSGYWLRAKLGMLFEHEIRPAKLEKRLLNWLVEKHSENALVVPHPRELAYAAQTKTFYENLGLSYLNQSLDSIHQILHVSNFMAILGGTSTAFSAIPDEFPHLSEHVEVVVSDSWRELAVFKTDMAKLYVLESRFFHELSS